MVEMKGNTRLLDKVLTDSGNGANRELSVYGVNNIDELLNVPILVKAYYTAVENSTMNINNLGSKPITVMKDGSVKDSYDRWVVASQLYQLIYNGLQFIAFPMGVTSSNSDSSKIMKLDFVKFNTSTKDNLIENVGEETLGELLSGIENNENYEYIFVDESNEHLYNYFSFAHGRAEADSASHYAYISVINVDDELVTFKIKYSIDSETDALTISEYTIDTKPLSKLDETSEAWQSLNVASGWFSNKDTEYRKEGDRVYLRGELQGGEETQLIGTLPVSYRPKKESRAVVYALVDSDMVAKSIVIYTDGQIKYEPNVSHSPNQGVSWLILDGASFPLN